MNKVATQVTPDIQIKRLEDKIEALELEIEQIQAMANTYEDDRLSIRDLAVDGLKVEEAEEKQWFLEQIALRLDENLDRLIYEPAREPFPKPTAHNRGY